MFLRLFRGWVRHLWQYSLLKSHQNMLEELIAKESISFQAIPIQTWTRKSYVAVDEKTNSQYRFGFTGGKITDKKEQVVLNAVTNLKSKFIVASGRLNKGLSSDFYQKIVEIAKQSGAKLIVNTSEDPLKKVLETGVYRIKPKVEELAKLIGVEKLEMEEVNEAAKQIIAKGRAKIVVISLGFQGVVLVIKDNYEFVPSSLCSQKSTVGASESIVGGIVWSL